MALPTRGQHDWDDDLNNYIAGLEARLQTAEANASSAQSNANDARNTAQSVKTAVLGAPDTAVSALINDTASTTRAALNSSYAAITTARPGNRWVSLGDSITTGSFDLANHAWGEAWPLYAMLASQGRLRLVFNAGVPGNTSAQMLARFDTDVTPYSPNIVTLLAGTNDIGGSVSFTTFKTNIQALISKIRLIGAVPVLATIPPRDAGGFGPTIVKWNAWLRDYAERNGISIMDFYRTLIDPSNGHYLAAYYTDGIHPNFAGAAALGEVASWVITPLTTVGGPLLPADATDTNNLVGAPGLFLTAAGSGVGTGWSAGSSPSGVTKSVVADSGIVGNFQKIVMAAASGLWVQQVDITSGFAPGDTIRFVGILSSDGGAGVSPSVNITPTGSASGCKPIANLSQPVTRGVFCMDFTIPAGTTAIAYKLQCGSAGATGTVQFGQIGAYNLTTMGLAA